MRQLLTAIVAITLLASSCTSDDPASSRSVAGVLDIEESTLTRDLAVRQEILVQRFIQECMIRRGFTYAPEPVSVDTLFAPRPGDGLNELDYAREWGLGISTVTSLIASDPAPRDADQTTSPNDAHLGTLSDSEADAWLTAFDGGVAGFTDQAIFRESCFFEAADRVQTSVIAEFQEDLNQLDERISQDRRFVEAERNWSRCMSEQGFDYATERAMRDSFFNAVDIALAAATDGNEAGIDVDDALGDIIELERRAAVASLECGDERMRVQDQVRSELEAQYLEANADLVDQVVQTAQ